MNKNDYLRQLEEQLRGAVNNQEVTESVEFYREYIEQEVRKGQTEEEVIDKLGSPNSIAKALIEASGIDHDEDIVDEPGTDYSDRYSSSLEKSVQLHKWKNTLILLGIVLLIIFFVVFAFRVFVSLLPVLIPVAAVLFIIRLIKERGM